MCIRCPAHRNRQFSSSLSACKRVTRALTGDGPQPVQPQVHVLTIVPVRRANKHTFFRINPDPAYRTDGCIGLFKIQDGSDDNVYIVSPEIAFELGDEVKPYMLFTAITSLKTVFVWPLQMPDADDRWHEAHSSTMDGIETGMHSWLKLVYNRELGAYVQKLAEGDLG
jgi:hypothetical protein